jgi:2-amino-4-hydroxy-6-hydroxymethyldihydropteridine diphosphokinase
MEICYLGVGSNLGDRRKNIMSAISKIRLLERTNIIKASSLFETAPVGGPRRQRKFLNAALKIKTAIPPLTLLKKLQSIEKCLGRKKGVVNGPRVIDLDILLYGARLIRTKSLVVPHPRMFFRDFVLRPLGEII